MYTNIETSPLSVVIMDTNADIINPDPIGQRPSVSSGFAKSQGIIDSILRGFSVGTITVRNIEKQENCNIDIQKVYPNRKWLVIDGGNRIRAVRDFHKGRFTTLDGKYFRDLPENQKSLFEKTEFLFLEYVCTDAEATEIFRRLNTVTPVNQIEMIMANDASKTAKEIRSRVKSYEEYGYNNIHPLFDTKATNDNKMKAVYWSMAINDRRKWDEYVGIAFLKAIGLGNVNAGLDALEELVETDNPPISEKHCKIVDRFLDDVLAIKQAMGSTKQMNTAVFSAFQAVWFALLEKNNNFIISKDKYKKFASEFFRVHALLTGNNISKYDDEIIDFPDGERNTTNKTRDTVKKLCTAAIKKFANPAQQQAVAEYYLGKMEIEGCIIERTKQRSKTQDQKFEMLALQNFCCSIDGEPLSIDDAIFGHDTPWAKGGRIEDGEIIRKCHNVDMGSITLDEYRMVLRNRKEQAA
jgi:hypothetical protein